MAPKREQKDKKKADKKATLAPSSTPAGSVAKKDPAATELPKEDRPKKDVFPTRVDGSVLPFTRSWKERVRGRTPVLGLDEFSDSPPQSEPQPTEMPDEVHEEALVQEENEKKEEKKEKKEDSTKAEKRRARKPKPKTDGEKKNNDGKERR